MSGTTSVQPTHDAALEREPSPIATELDHHGPVAAEPRARRSPAAGRADRSVDSQRDREWDSTDESPVPLVEIEIEKWG